MKEFFDILNGNTGTALGFRRDENLLPWQGVISDQGAAEEAVRQIYEGLRLKAPRFAWAASPASAFGAIELLREIHHGTRQKMVESLVPVGNGIEGEAKRVLLETIIDKDISVTMGGCLKKMLGWKQEPLCLPVSDLAQLLPRMLLPRNSGGKVAPAGWNDAALYPSLSAGGGGALAANALCFLPYMHVAWLVKPPVEVKTDPSGHLHSDSGPAMRFSDGFEVFCRREPEPPPEGDLDEIEAGETLALPAPEEDQ